MVKYSSLYELEKLSVEKEKIQSYYYFIKTAECMFSNYLQTLKVLKTFMRKKKIKLLR